MFRYGEVEFSWLGHDCFKVKGGGLTLYFDPYQIAGGEPADLILITHEHFDHLSPSDVAKISTSETVVVTIPAGKPQLSGLNLKEVVTVKPGEEVEVKGVKVKGIRVLKVGAVLKVDLSWLNSLYL